MVAACALAACAPDELELSSTAQKTVVVSPPSGSFGSVTIGTTSTPITFVVSPSGTGESDDTVIGVTLACPGFRVEAPGLPAQVFRHCGVEQEPAPGMEAFQSATCNPQSIRTYQFTATFSPTAAGLQTCNGQIRLANGAQAFSMTGIGALPDFAIDVAPRSINFGDIDVGQQSDARVVTVRNLGAMALNVGAVLKGNTNELKLMGGPPGKIDPDKAVDLLIACTPSSANAFAGTLEISSQDPDEPTIAVPLACNGILSSLDISPSSFDVVTLVGAPRTSTITITNDGNVPGVVQSITLASTNPTLVITSTDFSGDTLAVGESRDITVRYSPGGPEDESELGKIVIAFDNDEPRNITINGGAKTATVASEPNLLDFGPVCAGAVTEKHVDIFAADQGAFDVTGASAVGPFEVLEETLPSPFTLGPPGSTRQRFNVSVDPDPPPPGELTVPAIGDLVVRTTAPGQESYVVPLRATVLAEGITALPVELHLGSTQVAALTSAQTVTFTNCSAAPVTLTGQTITGTNAEDFVLTRAFVPVTVMPAETIGIDVLFNPKAAGLRQAQLVIDYTGGTTTIDLFGDGIGLPLNRESYYACNTGGAGGWLVGLVVFGLVVRTGRSCRRRSSPRAAR
jgi:hypothetical protein